MALNNSDIFIVYIKEEKEDCPFVASRLLAFPFTDAPLAGLSAPSDLYWVTRRILYTNAQKRQWCDPRRQGRSGHEG